MELYLHFPDTFSWRGAQLKHRGSFTYTHTQNLRAGVNEAAGQQQTAAHQ